MAVFGQDLAEDEGESLGQLPGAGEVPKLSDKPLQPTRSSSISLSPLPTSPSARQRQTPTSTSRHSLHAYSRSCCSTPETSHGSPQQVPRLIECTCMSLIKKGKYIEETCQAHVLTLRHSTGLPLSPKERTFSAKQQPKHLLRHRSPVRQPIDDDLEAIAKMLPKSPIAITKKTLFPSKSIGALPEVPRDLGTNSEALASLSLSPIRRTAYDQQGTQPGTTDAADSPPHHQHQHPNFSIHLLSMGAPCQLDKRDVCTMLDQYSKLITANNESRETMAILYTRRSTLLAAMERYRESLADAVKVLDLEPHATIGYFRKGFALCGLHRFTEASEVFRAGLEYDMDCQPLHHALQVSLRFMHMPSPRKASILG